MLNSWQQKDTESTTTKLVKAGENPQERKDAEFMVKTLNPQQQKAAEFMVTARY